MSKSSKKGNELHESDFKEISEMLWTRKGVRYSTNYIRRVLDVEDRRRNQEIKTAAAEYVELKKEFQNRLKSDTSTTKKGGNA